MQRCPKCNRTYPDETQKFCTFDGGRLMVDAEAPTTLDLGATVFTNPPPSPDMGATVTGPDPEETLIRHQPDFNKTVAGVPPATSEISSPAPTGPTTPPHAPWQGASQTPQPPPETRPPSPPPSSPPDNFASQTTSPLMPPSTVASQPVTAPVSSQTVASSTGPVASAAAQSGGLDASGPVAPSSVGAAPTAPRKSNRMPLVFGGLAALLLLVLAGIGAIYFFVVKRTPEPVTSGSSISKEPGSSTTGTSANANTSNPGAGTTARQPPVEAPPNATKFTSSRDKLTGSLAEHFVDFSLYYPNTWTVDEKAGSAGSGNFFKADRTLSDDTGDYVLERAAVSWYQSNGTMQLDRPIFPNRVEYFNNLFSKDYPEYQKVSEGETKFNGLDGYEFTFKSLISDTGKGDIDLWGRVIFLPVGSEDARNGIVLLMLASSAAPEIKSAEDVGQKGELPVILKTFRLGPS